MPLDLKDAVGVGRLANYMVVNLATLARHKNPAINDHCRGDRKSDSAGSSVTTFKVRAQALNLLVHDVRVR